MEKNEKSVKEPGKLRQFLAAIVVNLSAISYGSMVGWPSPFSPQLQSSLSPVGNAPMTDDEVSWLSAIMFISGTIMTLLFSVIPHTFSRKRLGYVTALPLGISWLFIALATEHAHIYVARFLCGMGGGSAIFLVSTYISEISSDDIRGVLGSILMISLNLGTLLTYIFGGMMSLRNFAVVSLAIPILFASAFTFMPESPVYLIRQNLIPEAIRSLMWLRSGDSLTVKRIVSQLQAEFKGNDESAKCVRLSDVFRDKATIKGLIIALGLVGGQQFCGIIIMVTYTETIFDMTDSTLSSNMATIIVGAIQFLSLFVASFLVERAGRRKLILVSCAGICVCHCMMGVYFYFQEHAYNLSNYGWLPVVVLSIFMIMYTAGMAMVPVVVTSEIFSYDMSGFGMSVSLTFLWFVSFLVMKIFPYMVSLFGMYGCFFFFATSCACSFVFSFMLLPETKGRMREDIVNELNGISNRMSVKRSNNEMEPVQVIQCENITDTSECPKISIHI